MDWTTTEAVIITDRGKTGDLPSCLLVVEECSLVRDGEELILRDIQTDIDWVYIGDIKKAGLFSHLVEIFKEDAMNNLSTLFSEITHAKSREDLHHHGRIVIVKSVVAWPVCQCTENWKDKRDW